MVTLFHRKLNVKKKIKIKYFFKKKIDKKHKKKLRDSVYNTARSRTGTTS